MFTSFLQKFFSSSNDRYVKSLQPLVNEIRKKEIDVENLSDDDLKARTNWLKERYQKGETLDQLLPDAFATVREASKRTLKMRHFDVQMMGGIILHRGLVVEMATGEGKTLIATLPAYLNALSGKGVHVVTVNDYLARRDSAEMGKIFTFLDLTVGCILHELDDHERQVAYNADITYATNNELGFDYLRDNMKFRLDQMAQRAFNYAIVDEVDSILIDEARTPLIISGPAEDSSDLYQKVNQVIPNLTAEDYEKDEKSRSITLTEVGSQKVEGLLEQMSLIQGGSLYDIHNISLVHHVNQALKAHQLFAKDVDYMVKDDKVVIIDEFTGRMMEGRRYSDGLHQALEAKENVTIQMENQTLASITFQNLFRIYPKLSGMTGTAKTEAAELNDIYKLEVIQVPTNLPMIRKDLDDEVYRTADEKYQAIVDLIQECQTQKQPVLVGTVSIEKSEYLSELLKKHQIPHKVLNARFHEQEAGIVAQAGRLGAVTIATNMAGRGTDIKLGGNAQIQLDHEAELANITDESQYAQLKKRVFQETADTEKEVLAAGGLCVIGTERHESRRIDNQLRGRAGRQGDPGKSKFFLCLEDDLMRVFGSDRLDGMLQKLGLKQGEAITHPWINKALERAQQKVEARNYDIRKNLLKYDDVMNEQRKVIYKQRHDIMTADEEETPDAQNTQILAQADFSEKHDAKALMLDMQNEVLDACLTRFVPEDAYPDQWELKGLHEECLRIFNLDLPIDAWAKEEGIASAELRERISQAVDEKINGKEKQYGSSLMRMAEKSIMLRVIDQVWKEHLHSLDFVRQGINLRAYAQRDPLNEYKQEAFTLFQDMLGRIREQVITAVCHVELYQQSPEEVFNAALEDIEESQRHLFQDQTNSIEDYNQPSEILDKIKEGLKTKSKKSISEKKSEAARKPASTKNLIATKQPKVIKNSVEDSQTLKNPKTIRKPTPAHKKVGVQSVDISVLKNSDLNDPNLSRNSLCPCGSGKRYKHCHGAQ
ncbi:MAG: preprotein translocase subunit SecA [Janthinobacterium lividum]